MSMAEAIRTGMAITGAGLVSAGAWMWWPPAGCIVGGMLLLAGAIAGWVRG